MSAFLQAQRLNNILDVEPWRDVRNNRYEWQMAQRADFAVATGPMGWTTSRFAFGAGFGTDDQPFPDAAPSFEWPLIASGISGGFHLCGTTRDANGNALGSCIVQLFRTVDDAIMCEATSGPTGEYCVTSQFNVAHYLVAYKPGTVDVSGASINTLVPTLTRAV